MQELFYFDTLVIKVANASIDRLIGEFIYGILPTKHLSILCN